jgi:hypothetical protein
MLPYDELLEVQVGGRGVVTSGGGFVGGGFGVVGALRGIAVASMLNNVMSKTAIDSYIRLTSRRAEMLLSHWKYRPETVRNSLATIWVRHLAIMRTPTVIAVPAPAPELPPAGPVDELERLTRLHAAGTLTDNEFEAARSKHIRALREERG